MDRRGFLGAAAGGGLAAAAATAATGAETPGKPFKLRYACELN